MNHRFISSFLVASSGFLGFASFAGTMGPIKPEKSFAWVVSIAGGPVWEKAGKTQTLYLTQDIEKTYVYKKSTKAIPFGELFLGAQTSLTPRWISQLGLAVATAGNAKLKGTILDDADPQFDNHSYQYKVRNTRVALKSKLMFDDNYWAIPWVGASIGVGFNRAHHFTNTPLICEALPNENFSHYTKTSLSYSLGLGLQKTIDQHWQIGAGYEFTDWGKNNLGRAPGQTQNHGLALNHFYTNGVLFNITYVA